MAVMPDLCGFGGVPGALLSTGFSPQRLREIVLLGMKSRLIRRRILAENKSITCIWSRMNGECNSLNMCTGRCLTAILDICLFKGFKEPTPLNKDNQLRLTDH